MEGYSGNVNGEKTTFMENRKKEKDESGELGDQHDVVWSSCQRCEGVEHHEISCKAKRMKGTFLPVNSETSRRSGTRRASSPGRDLAERGKARGMTSTSRNSNALRLGRDTASTLGKGMASNSGRGDSFKLTKQHDFEFSKGQRFNFRKGRNFEFRKGTALSLQRGGGSCSRRGTIEKGASSSSGRGI